MSNVAHAYALLQTACRLVDAAHDHSVGAYVSLAISMIEEKYGIGEDGVANSDAHQIPPPIAGLETGAPWG